MTSTIRGVEDFIVEDGEVEGETETDGVGGCEFRLSNVRGGLVGVMGVTGGFLSLVAKGEFSKVSVVVSLPGKVIMMVLGLGWI